MYSKTGIPHRHIVTYCYSKDSFVCTCTSLTIPFYFKVCRTNKRYFNGKCYVLNNRMVSLQVAGNINANYGWNMAAIETKEEFNFLKLYYLNSGNLAGE